MRGVEYISVPFAKYFFLLIALCTLSCNKQTRYTWIESHNIQFKPTETARKRQGLKASCMDYQHYIPGISISRSDFYRRIRLEFHVMNTADSTQNFNEEQAYRFIQEMIDAVNQGFEKNQQMWLPLGNKTPALPVRIACMLYPDPSKPEDTGVYFHYDDETYFFVSRGANRNNSDQSVIRKYKTRDSVLSVFMMPHHRDSIASETYTPFVAGIALSSGLKIAGLFENGKQQGWEGRGLLAHELGHALGLSHTWPGYDGCDDTPAHTNCWNFSETPPCDTEVSNNLMDYNPHQTALSQCQIGKMHLNISRLNSAQRLITSPDWCTLDTLRTYRVSGREVWSGSQDLSGHLHVLDGAVLEVHCRVSLPPGGTIFIEPGGTLILSDAWLHQDCGDQWAGIIMGAKGKRRGELTVLGDVKVDNCRNCPSFQIPVSTRP